MRNFITWKIICRPEKIFKFFSDEITLSLILNSFPKWISNISQFQSILQSLWTVCLCEIGLLKFDLYTLKYIIIFAGHIMVPKIIMKSDIFILVEWKQTVRGDFLPTSKFEKLQFDEVWKVRGHPNLSVINNVFLRIMHSNFLFTDWSISIRLFGY